MYPLLLLSLVSLTLIAERCFFWSFNSPRVLSRVRRGIHDGRDPKAIATSERGAYGRFATNLLLDPTEPGAHHALERARHDVERFATVLATVVSAAPLLGILGTVTGIIDSFQVLSSEAVTDPTAVAGGISEALLTTAFGLIIALTALFPSMIFRGAADRALGRMETLATLVVERHGAGTASVRTS